MLIKHLISLTLNTNHETEKAKQMSYDHDPNLISIAKKTRYLERQIDALEWESGLDDPRLAGLMQELAYYRKLEEEGQLYEPRF